MLTPPTTTAAMTCSVTPLADVASMVPNSMPHRMPATPASSPQTANTANTTAPVRMPWIAAASGLLPTA